MICVHFQPATPIIACSAGVEDIRQAAGKDEFEWYHLALMKHGLSAFYLDDEGDAFGVAGGSLLLLCGEFVLLLGEGWDSRKEKSQEDESNSPEWRFLLLVSHNG